MSFFRLAQMVVIERSVVLPLAGLVFDSGYSTKERQSPERLTGFILPSVST